MVRLLCMMLVMSFTPAVWAQHALLGIQLEDTDDGTLMTLTMTGITQHESLSLNNPDRFVVDLDNMRWSVAPHRVRNESRFVKNIRYGSPKEGVLRVVLDGKAPLALSDTLLAHNAADHNQQQLIFLITPQGALIEDRMQTATSNRPKKTKTPSTTPGNNAYGGGSLFGVPTFGAPKKIPGYQKSIFDSTASNQQPAARSTPPKTAPKTPAPTKRAPAYKPLVVLDAGHGGIDPGAIAKSGMQEKNVTLDYVLDLRYALLATGTYRVALTRAKDVYVPLGDRVKKARAANGDLLISVHADAHANPKTRGFSVYTISEDRAAREARKLERKIGKEENLIRGVDLESHSKDVQGVLIDLVKRDTKNTSATFAETLIKHMGKEAKLLRRPHRSKSLAVLTAADVPSVLIELGYLSNAYESKLLADPAHKRRQVDAIVAAINEYYGL